MIVTLLGAKRNVYTDKNTGELKDYFNIYCSQPLEGDFVMGNEYIDRKQTGFPTDSFSNHVLGVGSWQEFLQLDPGTRLDLSFMPRGKYFYLDTIRVLED